jgi:hypothetical protein
MLSDMSTHRVITRWTGFCASCPTDQPLLLVSEGPHGLRGWLAGAGPEDRELSYVCAVCGRVEPVPATEEEDDAYDATLTRWPDWVEAPLMAVSFVAAPVVPIVDGDVFGLAAVQLATEPPAPVVALPVTRVGTVSVVRLPVQRVSATDLVSAAA